MRPRSIVQFERVVLLSIVLGLVEALLFWNQGAAAAGARGMSQGMLIGAQVVSLAIYLLLLWFIARKGSFMARGIYVVLAVLGLAMGLYGLRRAAEYETVALVFAIAQMLLSAVSIWLLFRPDANAWFSRSAPATDPEPLP